MASTLTRDFARALDAIEIEAWADLYEAAPEDLRRDLRLAVFRDGPAVTTIAAAIDTLALNRVVGFGLQPTLTAASVRQMIERYSQYRAARFFVQTSPLGAPENHRQVLENHGIDWYNNWVKLYRGVSPLPEVETDLQVRQVPAGRAAEWARTLVASFDWDRRMEPWVAACVGRPGWYHYAAFDGDTVAAVAAMYARGEYAWIDFAGTLPDYRGRRAQSALIRKRLEDAAAMGVKWLAVETAEQKPDRDVPSLRNLLRLGFEQAWVRPNFMRQLA